MQSEFISLSLSGSIQISIISWHLRPLSLSQSDWDRYQQATSIVMTASIFRWRSEIASSYAYLRDRSKWREPKRSSSLSDFTSWSHIPQVHPRCSGGGDEEWVECQRNQSYLSHRRIPSLHLLQQVRMLLNPRKYMPESSLRVHWERSAAYSHKNNTYRVLVLWELEINLWECFLHFCLFHIWLGPGWPRRNAVV